MPEQSRKLGEILLELGVISEERLQEALVLQKEKNMRLGDLLVDMEYILPDDLTRAMAEQFDLELIDLESEDIPREIIDLISPQLAKDHHIIPIDFDKDTQTLTIAISDPMDLYSIDNLRFVLNYTLEPVLATKQAIEDAHTKYYGIQQNQLEDMLQEFTSTSLDFVEANADDDGDANSDDAPVIKLVHLIIREAVSNHASDIHIEPMIDRVRVRYRIDGQCVEMRSPPKRLQGAILARLKIMAKMDMAEKRRPQDGRIKISVLGREIDLRVNSLPASYGESIVMRILDKEAVLLGLDQLGFHPDDYKIFAGLIRKPNGIILVTGPTGSGKTTTLYAALNELNQSDRKIITAEEPVEYNLSGINQCQVNRKAGMNFDRIIRAMLRQAPNVILVGEIRDQETANMAIQAALTGHLVFSTLHTNDAPSALSRLIDMDVAPFLVASSIQAVLAQRLIRRICVECKQEVPVDLLKAKAIGMTEEVARSTKFYQGTGCENCKGNGFRGRVAIYEIMKLNTRIREMTFNMETSDKIRQQAILDGMHTLMMDGTRKVMQGITTTEEVMTVAKAYD